MTTQKINGVEKIPTNDCPIVEKTVKSGSSDLARIEIKTQHPLDLFKEWHEEAKKYSNGIPNALCLATVSKDLRVSARHVILRDYDERGFVIVTDSRSRKSHELEEVPKAAMCILWAYPNEKHQNISRQVRIEGNVEKLSPPEFRYLYDREPVYCKIRSYLCCQGEKVDWNNQKNIHDKLVQDVQDGKQDLSMPEHFIAYRLCPESMEFYFAYDHLIADRLLFTKASDDSSWTNLRIAA
ncbi:pyridoxine/pyridoxamine 5'-phosphate oxidase-like [Venturia canescens]|uniref:pyridoxine/pyridoxamine 5'-phosphate oxidase-like n=1 Tax=Venturia canescens TaxID=32260 RepID=UPI001C9CE47B|nr:pyridoxine/pyridoxamine 5'-phosphate oxidase-like [Venturia canescens]